MLRNCAQYRAPSSLLPVPAGEPFELHGVVLRSTLLCLLRSRRGFIEPGDVAALPGGSGGGSVEGGGSHGPGRPVLANGSADYVAAAAATQLE
jgi:hypothetical protein